MSITVRFAGSDDLEFVSRDRYVPREVVARKIRRDEVIVAAVRGEPVGYVRLEYLWSIVPYLALIHVLEGHRRKGVGKALLAFTTDHLRAQGHKSFFSSSTGNEPEPQEWHRHVGFEPAGAIEGINEGGVPEVFFRLEL